MFSLAFKIRLSFVERLLDLLGQGHQLGITLMKQLTGDGRFVNNEDSTLLVDGTGTLSLSPSPVFRDRFTHGQG